jgi:hypothetical protein
MAIYDLHEFDNEKVFTKEINTFKVAQFHNNPFEINSKGTTIIDKNKDLSNSRNFINLNTVKISQVKFDQIIDIDFKEFTTADVDLTPGLNDEIATLQSSKSELLAEIQADSAKINTLQSRIDTLENQLNLSNADTPEAVIDNENKIVELLKVGKRFDLYSTYDIAPNDDFQNTNKLLSKDRKAVGILETDGYFRIYVGKFDIYGKPIPGAKIKKIYEVGDAQKMQESITKYGTPLWFGMKINPGSLKEGMTPESQYYFDNPDVAADKVYGKLGTKTGKDHWIEYGRAEFEQGFRSDPWAEEGDGQLEIYAVYAKKWIPESILSKREQAPQWATNIINLVNEKLKKAIADDFKATMAVVNGTHTGVTGTYRTWSPWKGYRTGTHYGPVPNLSEPERTAKLKEYAVRKSGYIRSFQNDITNVIDYLETNYAMQFTSNNRPGDVNQSFIAAKAWSDKEINKANLDVKNSVTTEYNNTKTDVERTKTVITNSRRIWTWTRGWHTVENKTTGPFYTPAQIASQWAEFDQFKAEQINIFNVEANRILNTLNNTYSVQHNIPDLNNITSGLYSDISNRLLVPSIPNLVIENEQVYEKDGVLYGSWNPKFPLLNKDSEKVMRSWDVIFGSGFNTTGWQAEAVLDNDGIFALKSSMGQDIWSTKV